MKTDQEQMALFDLNNIQKEVNFSKKLFPSQKLICVGGKQGKIYCMEPYCRRHAICCMNDGCQCSGNHQECNKITKISHYNQKMESHINGTNVHESIDNQVYKIEDIVCNMSELIKKSQQSSEIRQKDKELIKKFQQDYEKIKRGKLQSLQFCGKAIKQHQQLKLLSAKQEKTKPIETMTEIIKSAKNQVNLRFKAIEDILRSENMLKELSESIILKKKSDLENLNKMLNQLNFQKATLVFKGSVDGMSVKNFYSKCDKKGNLLYLVENEFGFKYGGYSPCVLSSKKLGWYEVDKSMKSFVFSLDLNKKAKVIQKSDAVRNGDVLQSQQVLISFGSSKKCSLVIGANSLAKEELNRISFYSPGDGSSYQTSENPPSRFEYRGTSNPKCKLRQFEVYQLK